MTGNALFAGDATSGLPMQSADRVGWAAGHDERRAERSGGRQWRPADVGQRHSLLTGPNGLSSVFNNTNSNPAQNYNGAFYTAPDDGQPTTVLIGVNQTLQYSVQGQSAGVHRSAARDCRC